MSARDRRFFDAGIAYAKRHIEGELQCNVADDGPDGCGAKCVRRIGHRERSHEAHPASGVVYWPDEGECELPDEAFAKVKAKQ